MLILDIRQVLKHIEDNHSKDRFTCKKLAKELNVDTNIISRRLVKLQFQKIIQSDTNSAKALREYKLVKQKGLYSSSHNYN